MTELCDISLVFAFVQNQEHVNKIKKQSICSTIQVDIRADMMFLPQKCSGTDRPAALTIHVKQ